MSLLLLFAGAGAGATGVYSKAGGAILVMTADGADVFEAVRAGGAVSDFQAAGSKARFTEDTGGAVSDLQADGSKAVIYIESGLAESLFSGAGVDVFIADRTGGAVGEWIGSGASDYSAPGLYLKRGGAVAVFTAEGDGDRRYGDNQFMPRYIKGKLLVHVDRSGKRRPQ
jgi:hypothetical protein